MRMDVSNDRVTFCTNNATVMCHAALQSHLEKLYSSHEWVYDCLKQQPETVHLRGRGPVLAGTIGMTPCIVKRHVHGGAVAVLTGDRFWGNRRLLDAMKSADYLRKRNIQTPQYLFVAWRVHPPWTRFESGVERYPYGQDASEWFFPAGQTVCDRNDVILRAGLIGGTVRNLHDVDFYHRDLNIMNLYFPDNHQTAILDLDKSSPPVSSLSERKKRSNLNRLYRSIRKQGRHHSVEYVETIIGAVRKGYQAT